MPLYESVFIARQDISGAQAESLMDAMSEILTNNGATVVKREYWGLRNLAYRIKKNRKGHYALLGVDGDAAALTEMERNLRLHDDILRFLTVRVDAIDPEPSAILRHREERGPRGPRQRRDEGGSETRGERRGQGEGARRERDDSGSAEQTAAADKGDEA